MITGLELMQYLETQEYKTQMDERAKQANTLPNQQRQIYFRELQDATNNMFKSMVELATFGSTPEEFKAKAKDSFQIFASIDQKFFKNTQTFEQGKVNLKKDFEKLNDKIANSGKNLNFANFAPTQLSKKGPLLNLKYEQSKEKVKDSVCSRVRPSFSLTDESYIRHLKNKQQAFYEYLKEKRCISQEIIDKVEKPVMQKNDPKESPVYKLGNGFHPTMYQEVPFPEPKNLEKVEKPVTQKNDSKESYTYELGHGILPTMLKVPVPPAPKPQPQVQVPPLKRPVFENPNGVTCVEYPKTGEGVKYKPESHDPFEKYSDNDSDDEDFKDI